MAIAETCGIVFIPAKVSCCGPEEKKEKDYRVERKERLAIELFWGPVLPNLLYQRVRDILDFVRTELLVDNLPDNWRARYHREVISIGCPLLL